MGLLGSPKIYKGREVLLPKIICMGWFEGDIWFHNSSNILCMLPIYYIFNIPSWFKHPHRPNTIFSSSFFPSSPNTIFSSSHSSTYLPRMPTATLTTLRNGIMRWDPNMIPWSCLSCASKSPLTKVVEFLAWTPSRIWEWDQRKSRGRKGKEGERPLSAPCLVKITWRLSAPCLVKITWPLSAPCIVKITWPLPAPCQITMALASSLPCQMRDEREHTLKNMFRISPFPFYKLCDVTTSCWSQAPIQYALTPSDSNWIVPGSNGRGVQVAPKILCLELKIY